MTVSAWSLLRGIAPCGRWMLDQLELERHAGQSGVYAYGGDLAFLSVATGIHYLIHPLPGWRTDGASIPRPLRWWADPFSGPYTSAAVMHDILYRAQPDDISRAAADLILLEGMLASGVRRTQAAAIYAGVRAGGWWAWRKNRPHVASYRPYLILQPHYGEAHV